MRLASARESAIWPSSMLRTASPTGDKRSGDTYLYPFTKSVVPEVKIAEGYLVIEVPVDADPGEEEPD